MDDTAAPAFDAMNYLTFDESKVKQHTFDSLGLPAGQLGDICVTDPFPLFSVEAVKRMRGEIFRPETLDNYLVTHDDPEYQRCKDNEAPVKKFFSACP